MKDNHILFDKPYNLTSSEVEWVENTIQSMSIEEKIGQLFVAMINEYEKSQFDCLINTYHVGGIRYPSWNADHVLEMTKYLQTNSQIPLLIAANGESGGNGVMSDGTIVGNQIKIAATNKPEYAYQLGKITGMEASSVGCNWNYGPLVDLTKNWRNPIISTRTWSNDTDLTIQLSLENIKGLMENNVIPTAKHFPGDGVDERDHHLSLSTNPMSIEEWDQTFGRIYKSLIDAGLPTIMAGHIALPCYDHSKLPASLSKSLLQDLLRSKLNFNGLIVSDASHMVGMTATMPRELMVPTAIESGCDMFLFFNDPEEDFNFMLKGYEKKILSKERLHNALIRILGLKAKLQLHNSTHLYKQNNLNNIIDLAKNKEIFKKITDDSITLVKNKQLDLLPLTKEKHRRILLIPISGYGSTFIQKIRNNHPVNDLAKILKEKGFNPSVWITTEEHFNAKLEKSELAIENIIFSNKQSIINLKEKYDLIINLADVPLGGTVQRASWSPFKGTIDIPFYIHEVPTILISVNNPFLLADAPQVGTYINTYDDNKITLELLVEKLLGKSLFKGTSPVDAYCGLPDTNYWWNEE